MNTIIRLCDLKPGEEASVIEISPKCRIRQRLIDIGLIDGTCVRCVCESPTKGMKAFSIRGAIIAIRNEDCADITAGSEAFDGT